MSNNKLPSVSGHKICKALNKAGFEQSRTKGSHIILKKKGNPEGTITVVVPLHKIIRKGLLINIIKQSGLSREEFLKYLS